MDERQMSGRKGRATIYGENQGRPFVADRNISEGSKNTRSVQPQSSQGTAERTYARYVPGSKTAPGRAAESVNAGAAQEHRSGSVPGAAQEHQSSPVPGAAQEHWSNPVPGAAVEGSTPTKAERRPSLRREQHSGQPAERGASFARRGGDADQTGERPVGGKLTGEKRRWSEQESGTKMKILTVILGVLTVLLIVAIVYEIVLGNGTKESGAERMAQQAKAGAVTWQEEAWTDEEPEELVI